MLRKIILFCFFLSGFLFSQQYSNDKYEKYVGTKLGKYPLTVNGLKKAINSLDSGIVYISYPGLFDTTDLGVIPDKIQLNGYLFGNKVIALNDSLDYQDKVVWSDRAGQSFLADGTAEESYSPFTFVGRQESWWATLVSYNILDKYPRKRKNSWSRIMAGDFISMVDTSYHGILESIPSLQGLQVIARVETDSNSNNANYSSMSGSVSSIKYKQPNQTKPWWLITSNSSYMDFLAGSDTILSYNGIRNFTARYYYETGVYFNSPVYNYYSELQTSMASRMIGNNTVFHFFGLSNYPSWFGGTVNSGAGYNYSADTSSTDDYKIVLAGAHTLIAGLEVTFKALTANDSSATLQINALTAKALTKVSSGAVNTSLATGDILAGQIVKAVYDGTQFQIISRLAQ